MLIKISSLKIGNLKLKQLKVFMKVHGIAREDFRLSALESAHTCRLYFQRIFFNKTYAAFCLTHFRLDYNLLTYICFGLCVSKAAKIVTYSAYFNIIQKVKKLGQIIFLDKNNTLLYFLGFGSKYAKFSKNIYILFTPFISESNIIILF